MFAQQFSAGGRLSSAVRADCAGMPGSCIVRRDEKQNAVASFLFLCRGQLGCCPSCDTQWQIKKPRGAADESPAATSCASVHPVMSPGADTGMHERLQQLVACVLFVVRPVCH